MIWNVEKKQVDNIDRLRQIINSYDINESVTFKEFCDVKDENRTYLSNWMPWWFSLHNYTCL